MAKADKKQIRLATNERLQKLQGALNKEFYVVPPDEVLEFIKTPCRFINSQTGGFGKGFMTFINGMESSGKTTIVLQTIAYNQAIDPEFTALLIDAEHAYNPQYAASLGVDLTRLDVIRTTELSTGFDIIRHSCLDMGEKFDSKNILNNKYMKNYDLILIDSIDALQHDEDINNEDITKERMGLKARAVGSGIRKIITGVSITKTAVVFINQLRENIGDIFGPAFTAPGGNAQKFYAFVRIDMHAGKAIKDGNEVIGNMVNTTIVKNKAGKPKGKKALALHYGKGFSMVTEMLEEAVLTNVVEKKGAFYYYNDTKLGQGEMNVINILSDNPELCDEINSVLDGKKIIYEHDEKEQD